MYCNKCGAELPDGSMFCLKCGAPTSDPLPPFDPLIQIGGSAARRPTTQTPEQTVLAETGPQAPTAEEPPAPIAESDLTVRGWISDSRLGRPSSAEADRTVKGWTAESMPERPSSEEADLTVRGWSADSMPGRPSSEEADLTVRGWSADSRLGRPSSAEPDRTVKGWTADNMLGRPTSAEAADAAGNEAGFAANRDQTSLNPYTSPAAAPVKAASVKAESVKAAPGIAASGIAAPGKTEPAKKKSKLWIWLVLAAALVCAAVVILIPKGSSKTEKAAPTDPSKSTQKAPENTSRPNNSGLDNSEPSGNSGSSSSAEVFPADTGAYPVDTGVYPVDTGENWYVIGTINRSNWDTDFSMQYLGDRTYRSDEMDLYQGEEFKFRRDHSWDVNFGSDGQQDGPNFLVESSGRYVLYMTISADGSYATCWMDKIKNLDHVSRTISSVDSYGTGETVSFTLANGTRVEGGVNQLYQPLSNCSQVSIHMEISDLTSGNVIGEWGLYVRTLDGVWIYAGPYTLHSLYEEVTFRFDSPVSFDAYATLCHCLGDSWSFSVLIYLHDAVVIE